jgi:hypothetical protein
VSEPWPLALFPQKRPQPTPNEAIDSLKGGAMGLFEVLEPSLESRVEIMDDPFHAVASGPLRLLAYLILESLQALGTDVATTGFKPIAEKLEPLPWLPTVPYGGFIRVEL